MEIEKAIELCGNVLTTFNVRLEESEKEGIKLGIEALKEVKKSRYGDRVPTGGLLPGETTEEE